MIIRAAVMEQASSPHGRHRPGARSARARRGAGEDARLGHLPQRPLLPGRQVARPHPDGAWPRGRRSDRGGRRGRRPSARGRVRGTHLRAALRPLPLLPRGSRQPVHRGGRMHGRRHHARRHHAAAPRRPARPPPGAGVLVCKPRGRACQRRHPGDRPAGTGPGVPAGLRRDHRSDVCDAPRKRSPWRVGGGVRLRRRRPGGRPGSRADLRRPGDRGGYARRQAGDGAGHGRHPCGRSGRRRPGRADPRDRARRRRPRLRGDRHRGRGRPGVSVGARRRYHGADRPAGDGCEGGLRRVRRDPVRAHHPGHQPGRRKPRAARSRAGPSGRLRAARAWDRWSPTGCRSTRSTRRSRSPPPAPAEGS